MGWNLKRDTQRLWIRYRDSWGALAAKVGAPAHVWKAWATKERVKHLSALLDIATE